MYKIKIIPVWSTNYIYPMTIKQDNGYVGEYNYICSFYSDNKLSFKVSQYYAQQENSQYKFIFEETLSNGDSIIFHASPYKNILTFDTNFYAVDKKAFEIVIPNLYENTTNVYPDLIVEKQNNTIKLSTNAIDFYKDKIQITTFHDKTDPVKFDDIIVEVGEIHYSIDGTLVDGKTGLLWENGEEKTFDGDYNIKTRYIPIRNDEVYTNIYTITNDTKYLLDAPVLTYNSNTDGIDISYDSDVATLTLYKKSATDFITYIIGVTNFLSMDRFVNTLNYLSGFCFTGLYAYVEGKTAPFKSDITSFDLYTIPEHLVPLYPKITIEKDIISFDIDKYLNIPSVEVYYTLDGTEPTKNSIKYTQSFSCTKRNTVIKVKYFNYNFYSYTTTAVYYYDNNPDIVIYGKPNIEVFGGENKNVEVNGAKCYLDVIFNLEYEKTKILESISYILNEIEQAHAPLNISEEYLNKRFSGNNILIYSDETNSGILDINHKNNNYFDRPNNNQEIIQNRETYKLPYWDKGKWNFNYFRNNITTPVTEDELKGYMSVIYYNPNTNQNEIITRSLAGLKDLYGYNQKENKTYTISDLRSLIYGKYFVLRFIFNADKHIKFDYLSVNTSIKK